MKIQNIDVTYAMSKTLSRLAEGNTYKSWSDEFSRKEAKEAFEKITNAMKEIDFTKCTTDELLNMGFGKWDDESNLYLIPLWIFDALPDGIELMSISGSKHIKGKDYIDNDVRFGCLAYGIEIKE